MKISPKYNNYDWNNLNLSQYYSQYWIEGAKIVYDRIHGRYLVQIEVLEEHLDRDIWLYSGFMIMAVDCMVIETLQQFYLGIPDTNQVYFKRNWESFRDFFKKSQYFQNEFDDNKVKIFYDHVRNGLLHQSQTKKKTLINIENLRMIEQVNKNNLSDGIIVNRQLFHEALVNEFKQYIENLKTDEGNFDNLRQKCINKMRTIC